MSRIWTDLNQGQAKLYKFCVNLAARGEPFPKLGEIEERLGMTSGAVQNRMDTLRRRGYIDFITPKHGIRIVTVKATGQQTPDPRDYKEPAAQEAPREDESPVRAMVKQTYAEFEATEPYRRAASATSSLALARHETMAAREAERPEDLQARRHSEPCFKCGAAGDCEHRQAL